VSNDQLELLLSSLQSEHAPEKSWMLEVANGDFSAIPADLEWTEAVPLADVINGYRLLDLVGGGDPAAFLEHQREVQRDTGSWPGDAVTLWITFFLEVRADRFGRNDLSGPPAHLDLLCRQMRDASIALEAAHA
jgi:hypothetical protein